MLNTKSELIGPRYTRQPKDLMRRGMYYAVHYNMIRRCYNTDCKDYEDYGARGIRVCDRWLCPEMGLANFIDDMGPRPSWEHTLDRIDNDWIYIWYNCRWADKETQNNNKRNTRIIHYEGETYSATQLARKFGLSRDVFYRRYYKLKWPIQKALSTPVRIYGGNP